MFDSNFFKKMFLLGILLILILSITACKEEPYVIEMTIEGQGTVTKTPDMELYPMLSEVELNAIPEGGWIFKEWQGDLVDTQNPVTVTLAGDDLHVIAVFIEEGGSSNQPPVANNDYIEMDEDGTIIIDVLANDTDPDGDSLVIDGFSVPVHGKLQFLGDKIKYTAGPDNTYEDYFNYSINDSNGGSDLGTVYISFIPSNDAPTVFDELVFTDEGKDILIDVLLNDSDVDGDAIWVAGFTQGSNGIVTQEGNKLRYTPNAGFTGRDDFSYDVTDGIETVTGNVTVGVDPIK